MAGGWHVAGNGQNRVVVGYDGNRAWVGEGWTGLENGRWVSAVGTHGSKIWWVAGWARKKIRKA